MATDRSGVLHAFSSFGAGERRQLLTELLLSIPNADRLAVICQVASVGALGDNRSVRLTDSRLYPTTDTKDDEATHGGPKDATDGIFGCPWCRRPLEIRENAPAIPRAPSDTSTAFCALLYGNSLQYFIGALVLGWGLNKHASMGREPHDRVLIHTDDVTMAQRRNLKKVGWKLHPVQYLKGAEEVSSKLFHGVWRTRFRNVFTKIQVLELPYSKVVLLDLDILVRKPLTDLMALSWPAAHARGEPALQHGEIVPYRRFWENYENRQFNGKVEELPNHQQSSGINAGVMVLPGNRPDLLGHITRELSDWDHPEHYPTYMPEQEYLSRWFGTFEGPWRHVGCEYNYEVKASRPYCASVVTGWMAG
eukprot:GEMP01021340.1.p1 GENE.GEMP01021340.1~~GEMP01021340.1.p1  ORF type:complete len:364 (+),score=76.37 GEMP01021340.1:37-1128(+)